MPADQPRQPNRAWRQQSPAAAGPGKRAWQQGGASATTAKKPWSKKTKLGLSLGALGVVFALFVWLAWLYRPIKPACLILVGSDYAENLALPLNAYGWNALKELGDCGDTTGFIDSWWPGSDSGRMRLQHGPAGVDENQTWKKIWEGLAKKFDEKTVIVYLALHGGADSQGSYLLLNDPKGQERVSLKQILHDLNTSPELQDKNKLLVLDATQVAAHWPSGMLHNDFARKLRELQKDIETQDKLVVLCASDIDERSWNSEEWRRTIFGHYLIEGLKGAADANNNGRVTGLELANYARDKVKAWVQSNRNAAQTPFLLGGDARADAMELVQIKETYNERPPHDAPGGGPFSYPSDLLAAWEKSQQLRKEVPAPWVYSPHLWRRYQDALLRWEQLARAGDATDKVRKLKDHVAALEGDISKARRLDQASASMANALAMPALLGVRSTWSEDQLRAVVKPLWEAKTPEQRDRALESAKKADNEETRKLHQLQLTRNFLQLLIEQKTLTRADLAEPGTNAKQRKGRLVLEWLDKLSSGRPVEAHYLDLFLRDQDAQASPAVELIQQAIEVRVLAEQTALSTSASSAHSYGETVFPWIQKRVRAADENRQRGEDWLLGSTAKHFADAADLLGKAKAEYRGARDDAVIVQHALAVRDRALADLPFFAEWLARQRAIPTALQRDNQREILELFPKVESAAKQLIALRTRLDDVDPKPAVFKELAELTRGIEDDLYGTNDKAGVGRVFQKACADLQDLDHPEIWYDLEAALACPLIAKAEQRERLVKNSRRRSDTLNKGELKLAPLPIDKDDVSREAKDASQRQRRLARAVVNLSGHTDKASEGGEGAWHERIAESGEQLGKSWRHIHDEIRKGADAQLKIGALPELARELRDAEHFCRFAPGGMFNLTSFEPLSPVEAMRRLRMHDLLVWQARRTLQDHYFDDNPRVYYERCAGAYLADAKSILEIRTHAELTAERQAAAKLIEKKELLSARLVATGAKTRPVTTEPQFRLLWTLTKESGVPDGVPMVWLDVDERLKKSNPQLKSERRPLDEKWPARVDQFELFRPVESGDATATLQGVFRGQRLAPQTILQIYPSADTIVHRYTPPKQAGVDVRIGENFPYGAISMVIDYSGSMRYRFPNLNNLNDEMRYKHVLTALQNVLERVPNGTYLSVFVFLAKDDNSSSEIKMIRELSLWKKTQRNHLFRDGPAALEGLYPRGDSPIAQAMEESKKKGFRLNGRDYQEGPKVMLVLSDGDDNYFGQEHERLHRYLDRVFPAATNDIKVHVVCFNNAKDAEAKNAKKQFEYVKTDLGGDFVQQQEAGDKLAETIERTLRPRVSLFGPDKRYSKDGILASREQRERQTFEIMPGTYQAYIGKKGLNSIEVAAGDRLPMELKFENNEMRLQRALLGLESPYRGKSVSKDDWLVTRLQNKVDLGARTLEQMITVESRREAPGPNLKHHTAGFVWLELKARGSKQPGHQRWYRDFLYPAPVLKLEAAGWPIVQGEPDTPDLDVWWAPEAFPFNQAYAQSLRSLPAPGSTIRINDLEILVEDVQRDVLRKVSPEAGKTAPEQLVEKKCVVVMVRLPVRAGKSALPLWIQLQGAKSEGEEHHFFWHAGRYTAVFWGLDDPGDVGLNVISLDDFKRQAPTARLPAVAPTEDDSGPVRPTMKTKS